MYTPMVRMHGLHPPGQIHSGLIISIDHTVTAAGTGVIMYGDLLRCTVAGTARCTMVGVIIMEIITVVITTTGIGEVDFMEVITEAIMIGTHPITEVDILIGEEHMLPINPPGTKITMKRPDVNIFTVDRPDSRFQGVLPA